MKVNFYATLRDIVGQRTVEFQLQPPASVRQLLDEIVRVYPSLYSELLDDHGQLYAHVHVLVNGRDTPYLENSMDTILLPDDTVSVFPAVGGG